LTKVISKDVIQFRKGEQGEEMSEEGAGMRALS
jgi:hypothetical protein